MGLGVFEARSLSPVSCMRFWASAARTVSRPIQIAVIALPTKFCASAMSLISRDTMPRSDEASIFDGKTYEGQNAPELKVDVMAFMNTFPDAVTAEEVLKAVAAYMIPFELSDENVKGWIDDIFGGYDWTITSPNANAEVKIRLLLRNIMQLPEFQLM